MVKKKNSEYYILGLDVSTKTVGISLFNDKGELLELTHISPKVKPVPTSKTEELFKKADLFANFIQRYVNFNIKHVLIEEPLLKSNNVYTSGTLLRFNGIISKMVFDILNVVPEYISTYESRKNAYPELMQPNAKGTPVLFGAYPKDIDKKKVIWEKVSKLQPNIKWLLDKKGALKKENFDMADAFTCAYAYIKLNNII